LVQFQVLARDFPAGTEQTRENPNEAGAGGEGATEVRTRHRPNICADCYRSSQTTPFLSSFSYVKTNGDVAQAISRRLAIAAAQVRARLKSCGIYGGQSGTGTCFLRVLRFPLTLMHFTNCSTALTLTVYHPGLVQ
jgi:hypothetical protein